jgi:hypothetical protein
VVAPHSTHSAVPGGVVLPDEADRSCGPDSVLLLLISAMVTVIGAGIGIGVQ